MTILFIEEIGTVSDKNAKESDRLKKEVLGNCAERLKGYLSNERLKWLEQDFKMVAAGYLFRESG